MSEKLQSIIEEKLARLPRRPGVYLMKDERGKIIYVGKARELRQRVRSYFQSAVNLSPKVRALVEKIADLDYTVTDTEVEALILESNLIKEYRPRYNINLKDDKQYPYLRITVDESFPQIQVARRVQKDGARYFGPYTNAGAVRETIRLIRRLFPLRHCRGLLQPKEGQRPCLNRDIKRCLAPCAALINEAEYKKLVDEVLLFLEGKQDKLLRELQNRMSIAAENLDFETAARLRDQYRAVEAIMEKQKIVVAEGGDRDVIAIAADDDFGCVQLFAVRGGKLTGREHFMLTNPTGENPAELLAAFLHRFYGATGEVPPEILLSEQIVDGQLLEEWLSRQKGARVQLKVPQRGSKKDLVRLALDNAAMFLEEEQLRIKKHDPRLALESLAVALDLDSPPLRIEGYDISHLYGEGTIASMVVFEAGQPVNAQYRRFKIKSVDKPDDYASMREALTRRLTRLAAVRADDNEDVCLTDPFLIAPDLILIDGGKGQLSAAKQSLDELGFGELSVISLAKEEELIFLPGRTEPIRLEKHNSALQLLQRIRDEAHRYAVTSQRKQRKLTTQGSVLTEAPGVGEKRRRALLKHFGSFSGICKASVEELASVDGMNMAVAETLYHYLQEAMLKEK